MDFVDSWGSQFYELYKTMNARLMIDTAPTDTEELENLMIHWLYEVKKDKG